jgi:hypothetical protein
MTVLELAVHLRVGDRVVNCGNTGDSSPSVWTVAEVDGCGAGPKVRVWLRLVGVDRRGVRHEQVEVLGLFTEVYVIR